METVVRHTLRLSDATWRRVKTRFSTFTRGFCISTLSKDGKETRGSRRYEIFTSHCYATSFTHFSRPERRNARVAPRKISYDVLLPSRI